MTVVNICSSPVLHLSILITTPSLKKTGERIRCSTSMLVDVGSGCYANVAATRNEACMKFDATVGFWVRSVVCNSSTLALCVFYVRAMVII
jgi:hypothetical protein